MHAGLFVDNGTCRQVSQYAGSLSRTLSGAASHLTGALREQPLGRSLVLMRGRLDTDLQRVGRDAHFDEEGQQCGRQRQHRHDEHTGDERR
jgi:hypothetical protein